MGKKYIIEMEDKPFHKEDGDFLYRVKGFNSLVFDMTGVSKLTPYTEPDLDAIKQEEYEKGYKTAKVQCDIQAEKDLREVGERHYQKGLSDAWEAARTLWNTPNRKEIFGHTTFNTVLTTLTAQETIEKIRQYEQEKEEQIQVGDEVSAAFGNAVVTEVETEHIYYFYKDGSYGSDKKKNVTKTGRHFPEIAAVLEKMREDAT